MRYTDSNTKFNSAGRRREVDVRRKRAHPAPKRKVHRPCDSEPEHRHDLLQDHGCAALAVHRPPVGSGQLDILTALEIALEKVMPVLLRLLGRDS